MSESSMPRAVRLCEVGPRDGLQNEPTSVPTAAAVLNGVYDAVGVRITSLPATPEKVLAALRQRTLSRVD